MAANLDQIVEQLSGLTVIEAAELSKKLEEFRRKQTKAVLEAAPLKL